MKTKILPYKTYLKETVLLSLVGVVIGIVTGIVDTIFGRTLLLFAQINRDFYSFLIPFLALAGLLIIAAYQTWGQTAQKGMKLVFEAAQGKREHIPLILIPLLIGSTWLTHLFGGSAGREGVAVQLGAAIANGTERFFSIKQHKRVLLIVGMAAGFSGLFQIPLAATFFALEVLIVGRLPLRALFPALTAAFTADYTSHWLGLEKFTHIIHQAFPISIDHMIRLGLLAIGLGLVGKLFAWGLRQGKPFFKGLLPNPYIRVAIVSIVLSFAFFCLDQGRYSGLGTNLIEAAFSGHGIYAWDWFLKLTLTIITLSIGFQGGEVTPIFTIGACLGFVLAPILGLPLELGVALGYIGVFASATSTLIAPIFIGGELFGFNNVAAYTIIAIIAFLLQPYYSIYSLQEVHLNRLEHENEPRS